MNGFRKSSDFLSSWATISLSRRSLVHGVIIIIVMIESVKLLALDLSTRILLPVRMFVFFSLSRSPQSPLVDHRVLLSSVCSLLRQLCCVKREKVLSFLSNIHDTSVFCNPRNILGQNSLFFFDGIDNECKTEGLWGRNKSYIDCPSSKPGPSLWGVGDKFPRLWPVKQRPYIFGNFLLIARIEGLLIGHAVQTGVICVAYFTAEFKCTT